MLTTEEDTIHIIKGEKESSNASSLVLHKKNSVMEPQAYVIFMSNTVMPFLEHVFQTNQNRYKVGACSLSCALCNMEFEDEFCLFFANCRKMFSSSFKFPLRLCNGVIDKLLDGKAEFLTNYWPKSDKYTHKQCLLLQKLSFSGSKI